MADLTGLIYNTGALSYHIFYRVKGTNDPFLDSGEIAAVAGPTTPYSIIGLPPQEYEYYISSECLGDIPSVNSTTFYSTPVCPAIGSFNAVISGSNFIITYSVPSNVGIVNLLVEYPSGGTLNQNYNVDGTGQITIPIPPGQFGDFQFTLRSVCNTASAWYGPYSSPVLLTTTDPTPCTPPVITNFSLSSSNLAADVYQFVLSNYTPSVRVVIDNNTTGTQQIVTQVVTSDSFDLSLVRGSIDYNYTVSVFNLCVIGTDFTGDFANILVTASFTAVSVAGWSISAGPDSVDVDGDGVFGTVVTVNTNGPVPSTTRTTNVVVRFNCSTSGYAYVTVAIPPNATTGTTRDWNSVCTIDTTSGFINSAQLL